MVMSTMRQQIARQAMQYRWHIVVTNPVDACSQGSLLSTVHIAKHVEISQCITLCPISGCGN